MNEDFPLLDLLWTMLLLFGWALFFYLLVVVFRDLFARGDLSAWAKTGWVLLVLVLPVVGALAYLASQSLAMGERELQRSGATHLRLDEHVRSVTGDGAYRGLRDTTDARRAMAGPMRPA